MVDQSGVKTIDKKNKTVEFNDGVIVPLPDDLAFDILGSKSSKERKKRMSESVTSLQQGISNIPGGQSLGAFSSAFTDTSIFPKLAENFIDNIGEAIPSLSTGEGQEGMGFLERLGENVSAIRAGRREAKNQISRDNPWASGFGTAAGIGADIAMPIKGLPKGHVPQGATLGALYSLGSDKSIIEDPLGVAKDVAFGGGLGAGIGYGGARLERVARDRNALRKYPELLDTHNKASRQADKDFLVKMSRGLDNVQQELKGAGIAKDILDVDNFINKEIGMTSFGGSAEGNRLASFIRSLEKSSPEHLNSNELKKMFLALEERIATSIPQEANVLANFRQHLVDVLPVGAANTAVKSKFGTRFLNGVEKEIDTAVNSFMADKGMIRDLKMFGIGDNAVKGLADDLKRFVKSGYDKMTPQEFISDLNSGNIKDRMMWFFDNNQKIESIVNQVEKSLAPVNHLPIAQMRSPELINLFKARDALKSMRTNIGNKIDKLIQNNALSASIYEQDVIDRVGRRISNAVGISPRTSNPRPNLIPPVAPQTSRTAAFFETPNFYSTNLKNAATSVKTGAGALGLGALGYVAGLPKAAMGAGLVSGAGGLTAALRGVTSPTALGAFARNSIQSGGIRLVIESIADKYPSYRNGVLLDPQDRRAAAADIEQDQDLSLEDKAMLQAKINRGINIESLILEK